MSIPISLAKLLNVGSDLEWNGKTYKLTEANIAQHAEFSTWVEMRAWDAIERRQMHSPNQATYSASVSELNASIAAGEYEWGGVPVMRATRTFAGQKQLVVIVLRSNYPELMDEEIDAMYTAKHKEIAKRIEEITADPKVLSELVESSLTGGK
jgi:hypothetical protein